MALNEYIDYCRKCGHERLNCVCLTIWKPLSGYIKLNKYMKNKKDLLLILDAGLNDNGYFNLDRSILGG